MPWPLVWRSTHEHALRELADTKARLAAAQHAFVETLKQSEQNTRTLLDALTGHTAKPAALPMATPQRDEVSDAIELSAGGDRPLARHLEKWAKQQRIDGMQEHDIIQSILHWRSASEWDGDMSDVPEFL